MIRPTSGGWQKYPPAKRRPNWQCGVGLTKQNGRSRPCDAFPAWHFAGSGAPAPISTAKAGRVDSGLEVAVTVWVWPFSLVGPTVMPPRFTVCRLAFSVIVRLEGAVRVGAARHCHRRNGLSRIRACAQCLGVETRKSCCLPARPCRGRA